MGKVNMVHTILVPLDGSKRAEKILPYVEDLAQCYRAKVVFVHVLEPHLVSSGATGLYPIFEQQQLDQAVAGAEDYLAAHQGEFREKGIEVRSEVVTGPVVEAIINAAIRQEADLVAMASHGHTGLARVFYGSVAAGVLHRADRPLLLVRSVDHG
jgi:nucleotide-binding universal stress UspA family protein